MLPSKKFPFLLFIRYQNSKRFCLSMFDQKYSQMHKAERNFRDDSRHNLDFSRNFLLSKDIAKEFGIGWSKRRKRGMFIHDVNGVEQEVKRLMFQLGNFVLEDILLEKTFPSSNSYKLSVPFVTSIKLTCHTTKHP
jgi:hypothetical protein